MRIESTKMTRESISGLAPRSRTPTHPRASNVISTQAIKDRSPSRTTADPRRSTARSSEPDAELNRLKNRANSLTTKLKKSKTQRDDAQLHCKKTKEELKKKLEKTVEEQNQIIDLFTDFVIKNRIVFETTAKRGSSVKTTKSRNSSASRGKLEKIKEDPPEVDKTLNEFISNYFATSGRPYVPSYARLVTKSKLST